MLRRLFSVRASLFVRPWPPLDKRRCGRRRLRIGSRLRSRLLKAFLEIRQDLERFERCQPVEVELAQLGSYPVFALGEEG